MVADRGSVRLLETPRYHNDSQTAQGQSQEYAAQSVSTTGTQARPHARAQHVEL